MEAQGPRLRVRLLTAHVILFSQSRGGMLALIVTGFSAFFLLPRRGGYYALLALVIFLLLQLSTTEARTRFLTTFADPADATPPRRTACNCGMTVLT